MTARVAAAAFAATALLAAPALRAGEVALADAWLRPAVAGQPSAAVYVDIRSDVALTLVAARSPAAQAAELVENGAAEPGGDRVVASLPVTAGATTRLALRGSHVRLLQIREALPTGAFVPIELVFRDADGREQVARTEARVRGLVARISGEAPPVVPRAPGTE